MSLNGFPRVVLPGGVELLTLREVIMKIHDICARCPELAVVICAGPKRDLTDLRIISNNLSYEQKREMVARVHESLSLGTIKAEI
jgi:hypothetical protein